MDERHLSDHEANMINEQMARQMEERRRNQPERRQRPASRAVERRQICSFCFQRGDHQTAVQCLRALERTDRILNDTD